MKMKKDRIANIVDSKENAEYDSVRDEIISASGAFSSLAPLKLQDLKRLSSKGFETSDRLVILSQILFPQLCSIIGRGLTLEEIGLLVGSDQAELKRAFKRPSIRNVVIVIPETVENTKFVKIYVPLKKTVHSDDGKVEDVPVKEPLLAPKLFVDKIIRTGYQVEGGRIWRRDYISRQTGPLPTIYLFQSHPEVIEKIIGEGVKKKMEERMAQDPGVIKANRDIADAELKLLKPLIIGEYAPKISKQVERFLFQTHVNILHYAHRYRALNDRDTYDKIEKLAEPLLTAANELLIKRLQDQESGDKIVDTIDEAMSGSRQ
jgi:hypothetical protein